jgi:4-amino-4-deoxychorismate lyase
VIFLGADGRVLEAPTSSVVLARGRILFTPPDDGILAGITVRRLFRAARAAGWKVRTESLVSADLHSADGVWLASSARLLAPVVSIDGRPRSDGSLTRELATLLDVPATG